MYVEAAGEHNEHILVVVTRGQEYLPCADVRPFTIAQQCRNVVRAYAAKQRQPRKQGALVVGIRCACGFGQRCSPGNGLGISIARLQRQGLTEPIDLYRARGPITVN